jgi:hypothetical protein
LAPDEFPGRIDVLENQLPENFAGQCGAEAACGSLDACSDRPTARLRESIGAVMASAEEARTGVPAD